MKFPSYEENPELDFKVVVTFNGVREYQRNCKLIKGEYYIKHKDCVYVNEKWYRVHTGYVVFDYEVNQWVLAKQAHSLISLVVDFKEGAPFFGMATANLYKNCKFLYLKSIQHSISSELLEKNGYIEDQVTGLYFHPKDKGALREYQMKYGGQSQNPHNVEDNQEFNEKCEAYQSYPSTYNPKLIKYAKFLEDLTFGIECETVRGRLPKHIEYQTGLVECRDGSIGGAEFVSVPMSGQKGLQNVLDISEALSKRCSISIDCSYHIHIGNLPITPEYTTSVYLLGLMIQSELLKMFPYYKTNPTGIKNKNYCKQFQNLGFKPLQEKDDVDNFTKHVFGNIFKFLSDGHCKENEAAFREEHPIRRKWERNSRYYIWNLQNFVFSTRRTVEHRLHTGTTNAVKMINWLFICIAISLYARENIKRIYKGDPKINLRDVLMYFKNAYPEDEDACFLSDYLYAYYKSQRDIFKKDLENGDKVSNHDVSRDLDFNFKYKGKNLIS